MRARRLPRVVSATAFAVLLSAGLAVPAASASSTTALPTHPLGAAQLQTLLGEVGLPAAQAAQRLTVEAAATSLVSTLRGGLGESFAGAWFEPGSTQLFVATTEPAAQELIRTAGALPRVVSRDALALNQIMAELDARAGSVPDAVTGWYVDPATNSVVVSAVDLAAAREFAGVREGVRFEQVTQRPRALVELRGGDQIETDGELQCAVGFSTVSGGSVFVLTAGHCTQYGGTWSGKDGTLIGPVVQSSFPGNDFGLIQVTSPSWQQSSAVATRGGEVNISGVGEAPVGASVCRSGPATGYRCGTVRAVDQTVNYGGGNVVHGLTRTSACAEPGDSGGPFVSGSRALGILSGGSGSCLLSLLGTETFYQPVGEPLAVYGLTLVTGSAAGSVH